MTSDAQLFADRFIVDRQAADTMPVRNRSQMTHLTGARDLSSGDEVALMVSSAGGPGDRLRWSLRCGRFAELHHPAIARLLDYGLHGETQRFEAWRGDGPWRGSAGDATRARERCDGFLRASDLSTTANPEVVSWRGEPVVIPDAAAGLEVEPGRGGVSAINHIELCGLASIARPAVMAIAELLAADSAACEPRVIALWGVRGSGLEVATRAVARVARSNGIVPVAAALDRPDIWSLLEGRTLLVIDRATNGRGPHETQGWRRWIETASRQARSHVLLITSSCEVPRVHNLRLDAVPDEVLHQAVRPHAAAVHHRDRLARAAAVARGRPARFAEVLRMTPVVRLHSGGGRPSRAAESSPPYGTARERPRMQRWPLSADVVALRHRLSGAEEGLQAGRHVSATREVLGSVGALRRRGDHATAARGLLALARSRLRRGRIADARRTLDEARASAHQAGDDQVLLEIAVTCGRAALDAGLPGDAEVVLRGAVAAARGQGQNGVLVDATVALARALFWQGLFEESRALIVSLDRSSLSPSQVVAVAAAAARAAVGCLAPGGGQADAAQALSAAGQVGDAALVARAALAAAFAHLAANDHAAVVRDVEQSIVAARAAHEPLLTLRARLYAAEVHRRTGHPNLAARPLVRYARLAVGAVPATVHARIGLLRDLLGGADERGAVERLTAATGLRALKLFVPGLVQPGRACLVSPTDWLEMLSQAQAAPDDRLALAAVCGRVRAQLRAAAVAFATPMGKGFCLAAADGGRLDASIAERVLAASQPVRWQPAASGAEAGAPVCYGGRTLGAILARWSAGSLPDPTRVETWLTVGAAVAAPALAAAVSRLSSDAHPPDGLLGTSPAIDAVRRLVERSAVVPYAVLVEGESGSGKELVARALHRRSPRRDRLFCTLNCAALPDELFEAELFGHARGAFTGAVAERTGLVEEAHGGTLFLDEVGELSPRAQAKLLRTLQEGEIRRVGDNTPRRVDVRIVAATNRNLRQEVTEGRFRLDLLYRLDVVRISMPALRDRPDDLPLLIDRFWHEATERVRSHAVLGAATMAALVRYGWPGNVRELQNVMAALAVRAARRGVILPSALPPHIGDRLAAPALRLDEARRNFETHFVRAALARTGGRRGQAAQELGVSRQGLTKLLARLGVTA